MRGLAALALLVLCIAGGAFGPGALPTPAAARPAAAGPLVYRFGTYSFELTDRPCPFPELAEGLEGEGIPPARAAISTSGGQAMTACWVRDVDGDVMTADLAGPGGTLPKEGFSRGP